MPNHNHRLGSSPGRINIVTFSGAHGVGKSTLVSDLKGWIESNPSISDRVIVVPSISTFWFKGYQEHARRHGLPVPETYDDINRLGIREMMQSEMPEILASMVFPEVDRLMCSGNGTVIVDRWFGDIATYTSLEIQSEKAQMMNTKSLEIYKRLMTALNHKANNFAGSIFLTHVFVPVSSCTHDLPRGQTADKAHRGTQPVDLWESAYARVNVFTEPSRTLVIASANRLQRVEEILRGSFD